MGLSKGYARARDAVHGSEEWYRRIGDVREETGDSGRNEVYVSENLASTLEKTSLDCLIDR